MPADNIIHYILYGLILVATFIILKSPKKDDKDKKNEDN
ncbi:MAG: Unknown protein [uncultured Sulfurovum sp.]|uniref:Uncharacterized protein n=1 Tax=uncultured Sulfurovum sp. TaxID=269237 RepID=A0A6S6TYL1_9BACT|nr:MAG: Unknown protein [uncultured Sulfurovum sp.]